MTAGPVTDGAVMVATPNASSAPAPCTKALPPSFAPGLPASAAIRGISALVFSQPATGRGAAGISCGKDCGTLGRFRGYTKSFIESGDASRAAEDSDVAVHRQSVP